MGIPQIFTLSPLTQDDWEQFGSIHTKKKRTKYLIYKYLVLFSCTQTRGRTGMDVTPLVFETSASTDSAIWAFVFRYTRKLLIFIKKISCFPCITQVATRDYIVSPFISDE